MTELLAQVITADAPAWIGGAGILAGLSFTVWYAWNTSSRTIPDIVKEGRVDSAAARELFRKESIETRDAFRQELDSQRITFEAALNKIVNHCAEENIKLDKRWEAWTARDKGHP